MRDEQSSSDARAAQREDSDLGPVDLTRGMAAPDSQALQDANPALVSALRMAHLGIRVYPLYRYRDGQCTCFKGTACDNGGKHPIQKAWQKLATTDERQILASAAEWPDANWAALADTFSPIDADGQAPADGKPGKPPRECVPDTVWNAAGTIVRSGGGGYHLLFGNPVNGPKPGNWTRALPGIDSKGDNGGVILPGSTSFKGEYTWVKEPDGSPFPPLPDDYARQLAAGHKRTHKRLHRAVHGDGPIPEGQRDEALYGYIADRWNAGIEEDQLLREAIHLNRTRCKPPLSESVVRDKVQRRVQQPRRSKPLSPNLDISTYHEPEFSSDEERFSITGDGRRLAENFAGRICYVPEWGWLCYDKGVWRRDTDGLRVAELAKETLRLARAWAFAPERQLTKAQEEAWYKHIRAGFNRIPLIVQSARTIAQVHARPTDFDTDVLLLNTPTCVLDLRSIGNPQRMVLDHAPEQRLAKQTRAPYEPGAKADRFLQFLREVFPTKTAEQQASVLHWVQKFAGYLLTGLTREHIWGFFSGGGRNGKTTLVEVMDYVLGDYAQPVRVEMLLEGKRTPGGPDPDLAGTVGARFIHAEEPQGERRGQRAKFDMGRVKELTGGGTVATRGLHERTFSFTPQFKLVVSANDRPEITDVSYGAWERVRLVPFVRRFDEQASDGVKIDRQLSDKLCAEASGILNWALDGCRMYLEEGLGDIPGVIQEATKQYRESEDDYAEFFIEVLVRARGEQVSLDEAWQAFKRWREQHQYDPESVRDIRAFSREAEKRGFHKHRFNHGRVLLDCRLQVPPDSTEPEKPSPGAEGVDVDPHFDKVPVAEQPLRDFIEIGPASAPSTPNVHLVMTRADLAAAVDSLLVQRGMPVYLDTETTGLDPSADRLVSAQLYQEGGPVYIVDWRQADVSWGTELKRLCAAVRLVGHNLAFDLAMLMAQTGLTTGTFTVAHDTMLAEQVIRGGQRTGNKLAQVAARYGCTVTKDQQQDFVGAQPGDARWSEPFTAAQLAYMAQDVTVLAPIHHGQVVALLDSGQETVAELEHAIVPVMADMRAHGVLVDTAQWQAIVTEAQQQADSIGAEARSLLQQPNMNLDSPQQVREALAGIGLRVESTNEKTLALHRPRHAAVDALLRYREAAKVASTYGEAFLKRISSDGRLRADWHQIGTETGRMSCTNPALQTLPKPFRRAVIAAPGNVLLTADYSTMELRIVAELAGEQRMLDAFAEGRDLHTDTARAVFDLGPEADVTAEFRLGVSYRDAGKRLNFAMVYGSSAFGIANQLNIAAEDAEQLLNRFLRLYPALAQWSEQQQQAALRDGYTTTVLGRRRYYQLAGSEDWQRRNAIMRQAGNHPVQGSGADITKHAIRLFTDQVSAMDAHVVLILHDEIVVECRNDVAEQAADELKHAMCRAGEYVEIGLPEPEVTISDHWQK